MAYHSGTAERAYHLLFAACEVRARRSARHQSALSIGAVAKKCNFGGQQLLLHVLMTKAAKAAAAPRVNSAGVGQARAMHSAARHVDDFLPENVSALVHYKRAKIGK